MRGLALETRSWVPREPYCTSRLCRTIPRSDVSGAGRCLYQVARGATNVLYHHRRNSGEVEVHLCSPCLPQRIVTDNGPQFTSREFAENGVVHVRVVSYHPSSNGLAERAAFKGGLKRIRTGTLGGKLCRFLFTYRIRQSPAELLFSRHPHSRLVHTDTARRVRLQQDKQVQGRSQGRARQLE